VKSSDIVAFPCGPAGKSLPEREIARVGYAD
jgi:hypothetical protein